MSTPTRGLLFVDTTTLLSLGKISVGALNELNATGRQIVIVDVIAGELAPDAVALNNYEAWRNQHASDGTIRDYDTVFTYTGSDAGEKAIREGILASGGWFGADILVGKGDTHPSVIRTRTLFLIRHRAKHGGAAMLSF